MSVRYVTPKQLAAALRTEGSRIRRTIDRGLRRSAWRAKDRLAAAADQKGIKYRGRYKRSFRVGRTRNGNPVVYNTAPQAGVLEIGARPHAVSAGGMEALVKWAKRTLGITSPRRPARKSYPLTPRANARFEARGGTYEGDVEARAVAEAIAKDIQMHGQDGRYVFRDELAPMTRLAREEVERALRELDVNIASGRSGDGGRYS